MCGGRFRHVVKRDHQLVKIVPTRRSLGGFTNATNRREQKGYYDGNDGDDDKEFGKGKSVAR
jgi:hypothetical protein